MTLILPKFPKKRKEALPSHSKEARCEKKEQKVTKKDKQKNQAGFSLIELAVVLIIMGLLIGGVLKGRDLIESARLKRVVSQLNEYRLATNTFLDRYESLPGDFNKASTLIKPDLRDGNGNGIVDGAGLSPGSEALAFWSHLAGADLIGSPGSQGEINTGEFGKGAPESSLGGGFTIENNPHGLTGLWFVFGKKRGEHGDGAILTPAQALSLDKKLDNGQPTSGKVRAFDGTDVNANACVTDAGAYNLDNKEPACALFFQL
jgi:prepilin-type N-terminal cleavage/methylation domain-containing protein